MVKGHNRPPYRPRVPGTDLRSSDVPVAVIYRPGRSVTQSGPPRKEWVLEFERDQAPQVEPLMGWFGGSSVYGQIRLRFPDLRSAVDFAEQNDWRYVVQNQ